ncbi:TolC family protein [Sphingorhabdus sp.]|uniref:TolC family protein n=1 Tax=Sphingorhabdus sp. TaxID=1902408 RepID=UPI003BAE726A|nr:TolC family protein [Sphingomonadales bacterium]
MTENYILLSAGTLLLISSNVVPEAAAKAQDYANPLAARLPDPDPAPLSKENTTDPILAIAEITADEDAFHDVISEALKASPTLSEGRAEGAAALAAKRGAASVQFPRVDMAFSANRSVAREFSNDPDNLIERARGAGRVDATASLEQILYDFGASRRRIDAAIERIGAAEAEYDRKSETIALNAIGAWYDLFAFGHLTELAENFIVQNEDLRAAVEQRISQGVAAPVERARIDGAIASARLRRAQYQREYANAQARFKELFGLDAPTRIVRAPAPELERMSDDTLAARASTSATVRVAEAIARAAKADANAARAEVLPNITAGIDAGRYGLFEPDRRDYDVRGRVTVRYRLFGPGDARADEARARADAADARALSVKLEAEREARIAWADVVAFGDMMSAYREDYIASRITRDAVVERFRVARGTLYDALDAEDRLFAAAANYIRAMSERDAATFVALARAGDLLRVLKISPADQRIFR